MSVLDSYLDLEIIGPSGPVAVPGDIALPVPAAFAAIYRGPKGDKGDPGAPGVPGGLTPEAVAASAAAIAAAGEVALLLTATQEAAAEAALYDGPKIDTLDQLPSLTAAAVDVGGYVRVVSGGFVLQRVATAGHYMFGLLRWNVVRRNGVWPMLAFSPVADGASNDAAKIDLVNNLGDIVDLGGKTFRYVGVFSPIAAFINGQIVDNARTWDYRVNTRETATTVGLRRGRVNYNTPTSLRVDGLPDQIPMGGFRFMGNYLRALGRLVPTGLGLASHKVVSISTDLSGLTAPELNCWYGVFFCANPGDATGSFKLAPYFRALSRSGDAVTLARGGENQNVTPAAEIFVHPNNVWAGVECLVINQGGVWSGRRTTITANTDQTITLADATGIGPLDFILPAPVGFADYHYLGSGYYETPGEWRNIADSGTSVAARMINAAEVQSAGAAANVKIRFGGNISPLATGVTGSMNESLSTASTGSVAELLSHDSSNHDVWRMALFKDGTGAFNGNNMFTIPFSSEQALWHTTSGTLAGTVVSRSILTYGWFEA